MSSDYKVFKDPIYGYIRIPKKYMRIIDSPSFQRLRRVSQTSYSPLYSSALHNRFVHSMGVFHLAMLAMETIENESMELFEKEFEAKNKWPFDFFDLFKLAALLHDVGHSPFSHTGEAFYLSGEQYSDYSELHNKLKELVSDENFSEDIDALDANYANPHEIMSAIVGLIEYEEFFDSPKARSFFARCITGYQYGNTDNTRDINSGEKLLNCLVMLLNSKVIDVDKLDYLIRDAYIIGYDTVKIDYKRLLASLTIDNYGQKNVYELAYKKGAVSVIENVIYARDAEKKWIQGHPVVLYENYIISEIIKSFIHTKGKNAFSCESLSPKGITDGSISIRLLCDDDIITFAKNEINDSMASQLFNRSERMHAIWKSEAEYKARLTNQLNKSERESLFDVLSEVVQQNNKVDKCVVIDDKFRESVQKDRTEYEGSSMPRTQDIEYRIERCNAKLKLADCLLDFANDKGMERKFVIMSADCFSSGFDNTEFKKLKVKFDKKHRYDFGNVVTTFDHKDSDEAVDLYYIFYYRKDEEKCEDLFKLLISCFRES